MARRHFFSIWVGPIIIWNIGGSSTNLQLFDRMFTALWSSFCRECSSFSLQVLLQMWRKKKTCCSLLLLKRKLQLTWLILVNGKSDKWMDGWCIQTNWQGCCALCWFWTRSSLTTSVLPGEPRTSDCQSSVIMMHRDESEFCFDTCSSQEAKSSHSNVLGEADCLLVSVKLWGVICSLDDGAEVQDAGLSQELFHLSPVRHCDSTNPPLSVRPFFTPPPLHPHTPTHTTLSLSTHTFPFHHLCLFQFQKPCCDKHDKLKMISF